MIRRAAAFAAVLLAGCSSCRDEKPIAAPLWDFGGPLPGAPAYDDPIIGKLQAKWSARPPGYAPRTRHLRDDGSPKYTNRLFLESSPYLLQHAHNPVAWYPWGDEAFAAAARLKRPVFLSVGYSTCHWCHVMEEESFENEDVARTLNEQFVAIKVDREERPDVDAIYMQAVQALSGSGGWPMSVWLTPERAPFYGGTYFPTASFTAILRELHDRWEHDKEGVVSSGTDLAGRIRTQLEATDRGGRLPPESVLADAATRYSETFDPTYGGIRRAPKFPSSLPIRFLLHHHRRTGSPRSLAMATLTLEKMAAGGMHDQIGGGFHRYSTDDRWLVTHFEKMLYDNARLALDYLAGYQVTGREDFADVAKRVLRYVERDMTSPEGAFYSATDADSSAPGGRREEGWFYTWTPAEITALLGEERARIVIAFFGVTPGGNHAGRSILETPLSTALVAESLKLPVARVADVVEESRELLYAARAKRPAPARDEKILTAWNGLMISAYAQASMGLHSPDYAVKAARAATFVLSKLRTNGRLQRSFKDGEAHYDAYLDDYAFLVAGLLDLFEATGELHWLEDAIGVDQILQKQYEDPVGGFFLTAGDQSPLLAREKPGYDGAEPSGNSIEALNLLRLSELTSSESYRQRAERTFEAVEGTLARSPTALSEMLLALDFRYDSPKEIVIVTPAARVEADPFLMRLGRTFVPNRVLAVMTNGGATAALAALLPIAQDKIAKGGLVTAYVCEKRTCDLPTTDPASFAKQIQKVRLVR